MIDSSLYPFDPRAAAISDPLTACVIGPPAKPERAPRAWLTADVVGLARAITSGHDFRGLPVLADALEDAGCADAAVLDHCRSADAHVRGCWVVELLLRQDPTAVG